MPRLKHFGGTLLTVLLWAGLAVAVPLVGVRWVDSSAGPVAVLQSLVPLTGVLVAVLVVIAAVTRRWSLAAATGALLAVCITISVPSLFRNTVAPGRDDLVVMSANLEYGGADAQFLVIAAREHRVDVLVLIEVTPSSLARLRVAGLDTLLPGSAGQSTQGAGGTIIRSRVPMTLVQPGLDQVSPMPSMSRSCRSTGRPAMSCCAQFTRCRRVFRGRRTGGQVWPACRAGANDSPPTGLS